MYDVVCNICDVISNIYDVICDIYDAGEALGMVGWFIRAGSNSIIRVCVYVCVYV